MKITCEWTGGLQFKGRSGEHVVLMDTMTPLGNDTAASPKQLLLMAVCGCSAMDVVSLLKKKKQELESLTVFAEGKVANQHPAVFTDIKVSFEIEGEIDPKVAEDALRLSMTKYCSVSAMISKVTKIEYTLDVNGNRCEGGFASFDL